MATLYRVDGTQEEVRPLDGRAFSLEEMQTLVGGYIQIVKAKEPGMWIVCDEDGKVRNPPKPINVVATASWVGKDYGDPLVGTVLVGTAEEVGFNEQEQERFAQAFPGTDTNQPFSAFSLDGGPGDEDVLKQLGEWLKGEAKRHESKDSKDRPRD